MKNKIAKILRQYRKNNNLSADDVVNKLKNYNIVISIKTIYGYENAYSIPNADMFVALCKIYGITSLDIFFDDAEPAEQNPTFGKYNALNTAGKQKADEYITDLSEQKKYTAADAETQRQRNSFVYQAPPLEVAAFGADGTEGEYTLPPSDIT